MFLVYSSVSSSAYYISNAFRHLHLTPKMFIGIIKLDKNSPHLAWRCQLLCLYGITKSVNNSPFAWRCPLSTPISTPLYLDERLRSMRNGG
jgi:hypothetical protein